MPCVHSHVKCHKENLYWHWDGCELEKGGEHTNFRFLTFFLWWNEDTENVFSCWWAQLLRWLSMW